MHITVFGGANPQPGEEPYDRALKLGRLLGTAGHTVLTGGYGGTMEAVSRGAAEAGAHVIGVTCGEIEIYRFARPNPWVKEIRHFDSLIDRLTEMMNSCQAAIALPGGAGTLTEITLLWNRVIIKSVPALPIILVGPAWKTVFEQFLQSQADYISAPDGRLLSFAATVEEATEMVAQVTSPSGSSQKYPA